MPPKKGQSSSSNSQVSKSSTTTDKVDQLKYGDEELGVVVLDDENKFFDFTMIDKIDPNPTFLKEPALLSKYQREVQDQLILVYRRLTSESSNENTGGSLRVDVNSDFFNQVEPILIDAFTILYNDAIYSAINENIKLLSLNNTATNDRNSHNNNSTNNDPQDLLSNLKTTITKLTTQDPGLLQHNVLGSGTLHLNPNRFAPIMTLVNNNQYKMDMSILQPYLHSFNSYPPTTSDIFQPINSSHSTLFHKDRPSIHMDDSMVDIKVISPCNYYISQAVLRNYPIVRTREEIEKQCDHLDDQQLFESFVKELDDPTFEAKSLPPVPQVTSTQARAFVQQHAPRKGPSDETYQYVLFHDYITNNYYNVTNTLFTPQKTQLMYAMVIGAPSDVIQVLLHSGCSITQTDENGWTALRWALERVIFGRAHVYEAFGLIPYLSPDYFRDTLSRNDLGKMIQGRRRLNPVLMGLVKTIQEAQPIQKHYDEVTFNFPTKAQSGPSRPTPQPSSSPTFNHDFKLLLEYIAIIIKFTQRHPVSHYHSFLAQLPMAPPAQLYDHNSVIPSPPSITDPWAIAMNEILNNGNSSATTTTTIPTSTTIATTQGNNKKEKEKSDKDTAQLTDFLRGTLSSNSLPHFLQKHPYLFTGFRFDYSLPENQDLMMVNATTAVYMLTSSDDVQAILESMGLTFSLDIHLDIQSRLNQWYTYPDDTEDLKKIYIDQIKQERERMKKYEDELVQLKAERQELVDKIEQYNALDKATTAELASKRAELISSNQEFEQTNQTLLGLKNDLSQIHSDLESMKSMVKSQTKAHALLLADKERRRLQTQTVEATLNQQQQQLAAVVPTIFQDNGVYHANLIPGIIEPFSLEKSFDKATIELIKNVEAKRNELTPFDTFPKLDPTLDVSPANPNPYGLFCELYQQFIVEQPPRISNSFDTAFLKDHEQSLFDYFTSNPQAYPTQLDFWKQMLSQRAGLLHSAMVRMYQLEQLLAKYKEKTYKLISDLRSLEGQYAMIVQPPPPKAPILKDVPLNPNTKKLTSIAYDHTIPMSWKNNMCVLCQKEPKRAVTTCCYTMVTCISCQPLIKQCPQCKGKSGPLDTRIVKFH